MEVCGAEEEAISRLSSTGNTCQLNFIFGFGLFMGYVDNKKNIEYHQIYPLKSVFVVQKQPLSCVKRPQCNVGEDVSSALQFAHNTQARFKILKRRGTTQTQLKPTTL